MTIFPKFSARRGTDKVQHAFHDTATLNFVDRRAGIRKPLDGLFVDSARVFLFQRHLVMVTWHPCNFEQVVRLLPRGIPKKNNSLNTNKHPFGTRNQLTFCSRRASPKSFQEASKTSCPSTMQQYSYSSANSQSPTDPAQSRKAYLQHNNMKSHNKTLQNKKTVPHA